MYKYERDLIEVFSVKITDPLANYIQLQTLNFDLYQMHSNMKFYWRLST